MRFTSFFFASFFVMVLFFSSVTTASQTITDPKNSSFVIPYTYIDNNLLSQAPLPTASSNMINELTKCEASRKREKVYTKSCGYVYSAPYHDDSSASVIIESCRNSSSFKPGLYIFRGKSDVWFYPWYDSEVMNFACEYKSDIVDEPAYYGFGRDTKLGFHSLFYHYYVNLSVGHAYFLLLPNSKIKVLDREDIDLPS